MVQPDMDADLAPAPAENSDLLIGLGLVALVGGGLFLLSQQKKPAATSPGTPPGTVAIPSVTGQTPQQAQTTIVDSVGFAALAQAICCPTGTNPCQAPATSGTGMGVNAQAGDTVWTIAQNYCGNVLYYMSIIAANCGAFNSLGQFGAGEQVFVPQPCAISPTQPTTLPATPTQNTPVSYTVQQGDTLSSIAQTYCGDASYWPYIYQMNQNMIGPDPNAISPGEVLTFTTPCQTTYTPVVGSGGGSQSQAPSGCAAQYTTQGGETLAAIAGQYYGDASLAAQLAICNANPSDQTLCSVDVEPAGLTICIPPYSAVQAIEGSGGSGSGSGSASACATTYQTFGGETFSYLASAYLGSSSLVGTLQAANPAYANYGPTDALPAGLTICIPYASSGSGSGVITLPNNAPGYSGNCPSSCPGADDVGVTYPDGTTWDNDVTNGAAITQICAPAGSQPVDVSTGLIPPGSTVCYSSEQLGLGNLWSAIVADAEGLGGSLAGTALGAAAQALWNDYTSVEGSNPITLTYHGQSFTYPATPVPLGYYVQADYQAPDWERADSGADPNAPWAFHRWEQRSAGYLD